MAMEQGTGRGQDKKVRNLPKNFRQIGEPGTKKIYVEDYVYTYLNKLAQPGNLYARGAILFGKMYRTTAGNCMFISGAAACQHFEFDLEESIFTEENWAEIYRIRDKFFPELEIAGWFLSRMGFSTELNDKIIRTHMDNFAGENKVLYMIDALENEDAFYQFENYSLKKQKGYYIYYESNKAMKDYMLAEGEGEQKSEDKRRSATIQRDASVVKNYKKAMKQKKKLSKKTSPRFSSVSLAGVLVMVLVLFYGARSVYQFRMEENAAEVFQQQTVEEQSRALKNELENFPEGTTEQEESSASAKRENAPETTTAAEETKEAEDTNRTLALKDTDEKEGVSFDSISRERAEEETGGEDSTEKTEESEETMSYMGKQYIVQSGDTLAGISQKMYQSYRYIEKLAEANQIDNMDEIYPGQVLEIPPIED